MVAAAAEPSLAARAISGQEQRQDDHDKDHRKGQRAAHDPQKRLDAMAKELDLSSKQKDKVARIFQEQQQQIQALRGQSGPDRSQHKAQAQSIRQSTDKKLKDVLSKKQYAQFEAKRQERMRQMGNRQGGKQRGGPERRDAGSRG
ncbi:hypothetical protein Hsw_3193 [Hymenobacter swuensis DY53]|uniref:Uncharacterized protein n=1 Tax=Hymenobacter swuensis DY53 TaxID=1227739 RepID=W8F1J8_9BACT|nr:hypothetical protein Hsw_3193 [Hymenobacter swuensis DY53]